MITIGILDSGIGGLTVLKTLLNDCPNHEYIYYGDTLHIPYGDKPREKIVKYADDIIEFLENKGAEVIVIACGTLSSNIGYLTHKVPLISLLENLTEQLDDYNKLSIMATPLSIKTNAFKKYIKTDLNLIAAHSLVGIIESGDYTNLDDELKEYLKSTSDSDALLLGCTHYPIIKDYIAKYFKKDIICLDKYVVKDIKKLKESKPSLKLYFSKMTEALEDNVHKILDRERIDINVRK